MVDTQKKTLPGRGFFLFTAIVLQSAFFCRKEKAGVNCRKNAKNSLFLVKNSNSTVSRQARNLVEKRGRTVGCLFLSHVLK